MGPLFFSAALILLMLPLFYLSYRPSTIRILLALLLGATSFYLTTTRYQFPTEKIIKDGIADVEVVAVKTMKTPFGSLWNYKGILKSYSRYNQTLAKDIPIVISVPFEKEGLRPNADYRYQFSANLKQTSKGKYILTPLKNEEWQPLKKLYSLAEWRFSTKSQLQKHIQGSVQDQHVGAFLSGIATGEFDDRLLSFELGRFGLQHLMAISGLHFSILSALLAFSFGVFFSRKVAAFLTIGMMSAYFIFLGASPSVTRAWIAILIGLTSFFLERNSSSLNSLGIAALIVILWDPLIIEEIGFQFSFGITAAILLWSAPCDHLLQKIFAKRKLSEVIAVDAWDQHAYCLLHFFRQGLALCLAVNLVALPLTLYHFHQFPLMSLVYNLFFPFLMSFSLILLALACFSALLFPWLASQLHTINESYTQFVLNFAFNLPKTFDATLQVKEIPKELLLVYLLLIFSIGIFLNVRYSENAKKLFL